MEDENEQLDYDEDELEVARKKAKELQKAVEIDSQTVEKSAAEAKVVASSAPPPPSAPSLQQNEGLQVQSGQGQITTTVVSSAAPPPTTRQPVRYHINPNFNKHKQLYNQQHAHTYTSLPSAYPSHNRPPARYHPHMSAVYSQPSNLNVSHVRHIPQTGISQQIVHANLPAAFPTSHFGVYPNNTRTHQPAIPPSAAATGLPVAGNTIYINRSAIATTNNWDLMVDEFVRKNTSVNRRHHHYPRGRSPSRSRSRSADSSSSTTSSSSPYSSSSGRVPSTNGRANKRQGAAGRNRNHGNDSRVNRNTGRKAAEKKGRGKDNGHNEKITRQTIECARAIGLDDEYLKKIEEQNRLREEVVRRKNRHRKETTITAKATTTKGKPPAVMAATGGEEAPASKRQKVQGPPSGTNATAAGTTTAGGKLKPYLAVMVTNVRALRGSAIHRVGQLAASIGPIKKIWQESVDDCHVIFEKHEHAKQFMLAHHGKLLDKARIDLSLKKVFLNISATNRPT